MDSNFKLFDLKLMLDAIHAVRVRWMDAIRRKQVEILTDRPKLTFAEAHSEALMSSEAQAEFQNLMVLYGTVGEGATSYADALDAVVVETENMRKVA